MGLRTNLLKRLIFTFMFFSLILCLYFSGMVFWSIGIGAWNGVMIACRTYYTAGLRHFVHQLQVWHGVLGWLGFASSNEA